MFKTCTNNMYVYSETLRCFALNHSGNCLLFLWWEFVKKWCIFLWLCVFVYHWILLKYGKSINFFFHFQSPCGSLFFLNYFNSHTKDIQNRKHHKEEKVLISWYGATFIAPINFQNQIIRLILYSWEPFVWERNLKVLCNLTPWGLLPF